MTSPSPRWDEIPRPPADRRPRRFLAAVLAAALAMGLVVAAVPPARATATFDLERLGGKDRFGTAEKIATATFPDGSTHALLARSDDFADALAGNYLAGSRSAPVLLSRSDDVPTGTIATLKTLGVTTVTLLGGTSVLTGSVVDELENEGLTVERESGIDRYATAAAVATSTPAGDIGTIDGKRVAVVATGEDFPDAMAGGPLAYARRFPVLLTTGSTLHPAASGALDSLDIGHVLVLGGTAVVSDDTVTQIEAKGITAHRLAGSNRWATAVEIAEFAVAELGFGDDHVDVATGAGYADAISGGPHAGTALAPILLTSTELNPTCDFLASIADTVSGGHIFGGTVAVTAETETALEQCGGGAADGGPTMVAGEADTGRDTITITYDMPVTCAAGSAAQFAYGGSSAAEPTTADCSAEEGTLVLTFADVTGDGDLTYTQDVADPTQRVTSLDGRYAVTPQTIAVTDPPPQMLDAEADATADTVTVTYNERVSCVEDTRALFSFRPGEGTAVKPTSLSGCVTAPSASVVLEFADVTGPGTLIYTQGDVAESRITDSGGKHAISPQSLADTPPKMVAAVATPSPADDDPSAGTTSVAATYDQALACDDVGDSSAPQFSIAGMSAPATMATCDTSTPNVVTLTFDGTTSDTELTYTAGAEDADRIYDAAGAAAVTPQTAAVDAEPFMRIGALDVANARLTITYTEAVTCVEGTTELFQYSATDPANGSPTTVRCTGETVVLGFDALSADAPEGTLTYAPGSTSDAPLRPVDAAGNQAAAQTLDVVKPRFSQTAALSVAAEPTTTTVGVTYTEDIDCSAVVLSDFSYTGATGSPASGTCDGATLTLVFGEPLAEAGRDETKGDLHLAPGKTGGITDRTGNLAVAGDVRRNIPSITGAVKTGSDSITVTYSEPVTCATTGAGQFEYTVVTAVTADGITCEGTTTVVIIFPGDVIGGGTLDYAQSTDETARPMDADDNHTKNPDSKSVSGV